MNYEIIIELFGGEPIQSCNKNILNQILEFARKNKYFVTFTTNGVEIDEFFDLFITYNGYINSVYTTLDGTEQYHNSRRIFKKDSDSFNRILRNIDFLLDLEINLVLSINFDKSNLEQLEAIIDLCDSKNWTSNKYFELQIGRVDDRLFETNYNDIISEGQLLEYIYKIDKKIDMKSKARLAFLKSLFYVANRFKISFNQTESGRQLFHYCWSTSPLEVVKYIDSELNVFRCTYTVGREDLSIGTLQNHSDGYGYFNNYNLFNIPKCMECKLGGYCSGGCRLSSLVDEDRQCKYELSNFDYFINKVIIPSLKEKFNSTILI
ncbi:SPASM domain-containing protein [Romboutsia lituseburensis]|uniref:SPASM domain-containing protein n=1 Tax=Romboutsia lituseburensis TaxID=1537 RepID=UPI0022EA50F4|nr:SPASM domain-containing protein [Romboutsia lituseburensis]